MFQNKLSHTLRGPSGEAPKMAADMNKGFTQEELVFIQSKQLPLPADIFLRTLKEPDYAKQILDVSCEINKAQQKLPERKRRMK